MNTELKKNFVVSLILHAAVLACIFLVTAFAPRPRLDTPIMMDIGGPGAGSGGGEETPPPPPQPLAKVETPQPKQEETPPKVEPARIIPKQEDMVVPKPEQKTKVPEKKPEPKKEEIKKVEPKKEDTKPKVEVSKKLVKRTDVAKDSTSKTAKPDPSKSADAIRKRMAAKLGPVGPVGGNNSNSEGSGSGGTEYDGILYNALFNAWEIPGQVTPNMSVDVLIRVTRDGSLSLVRILKGSGDAIMDESVQLAIRKTPKVPPLPSGMGNVYDCRIRFQKIEG